MRKPLLIGAAAMLLAPLAASADAYQYIISGYPAANESYAAASSGIPLDTRYRTWDESDGIPFRSDKFRATVIVFR